MAIEFLIKGKNKRPEVAYDGRPLQEGDPERILLAEVLFRAINDMLDRSRSEMAPSANDKRTARKWVFEARSRRAFSFIWVCEELDLDPESIRKKIRELIEQANEQIAPTKRKCDLLFYFNHRASAKRCAA